MDVPPRIASGPDAILINPAGPPALYRLNTERKRIAGNPEQIRRWTYGQKDTSTKNKVILMVGETGSGKTTIINTMITYLLGLKFEDEEFYQITEEEDDDIEESITQTTDVAVYEVFVKDNPTSLTLIDTPGYGNTDGYGKDRDISENLIRLFSDEDGIHYVDAVCFVMKASQNRLSDKQLYIFHSVLSIFGGDIENNMVFVFTHSDGWRPTNALNVIKKAQVHCRKDAKKQPVYFLFNNQQKEIRHERNLCVLKSAWELGEVSMNEFLTLLETMNRKSVQMTLDVLKERRQLETSVSDLRAQIKEEELKTKEVTQIQSAFKKWSDRVKKCENFEFTVDRIVKEKVSTENEWLWNKSQTCCTVCEENCHVNCWRESHPSNCEVMKKEHCTVCTGKCHYRRHIRENRTYKVKTKTVIMSFKELEKEYERTGEKNSFDQKIYDHITMEHEQSMKQCESKAEKQEKLISDLEMIKNVKSGLLADIYMSIMGLPKIALKPDSAFMLQHLDFLIPRLREEGKEEWIKILEDLRKAGEDKQNRGALRHVLEFTRKEVNQKSETAAMASSKHHLLRKSMDEPPEIITEIIRLKDEFIELYERDHPQLQQTTKRLHHILKTFETGYRQATKEAKDTGWDGRFALAILFFGLVVASITPAIFVLAAFLALTNSTRIVYTNVWCKSQKMPPMTQFTEDIEAQLAEIQDKINPMVKKRIDIYERTKNILREQDAIRMEDIAELTGKMSEITHLIESSVVINNGFSLVTDMISLAENSRRFDDLTCLAKQSIHKEIDSSTIKTKLGKLIVEMRTIIKRLQDIVLELEETKDELASY